MSRLEPLYSFKTEFRMLGGVGRWAHEDFGYVRR